MDRYGAITIAICNNNKSIYLSIYPSIYSSWSLETKSEDLITRESHFADWSHKHLPHWLLFTKEFDGIWQTKRGASKHHATLGGIKASPSHCSSWILSTGYMGVSIAMEVPLYRWMVYDGKSYWNGWLGVTPFVETPIWLGVMIGYASSLRTDTRFSNFWEAAHYPGQAQHTKPGSTASQDPGFPRGLGGWYKPGRFMVARLSLWPSGRIIVHQGWLVLLQW